MLVGLWYGCLFRFPVLYLWLISSAVGLVFALGGVCGFGFGLWWRFLGVAAALGLSSGLGCGLRCCVALDWWLI